MLEENVVHVTVPKKKSSRNSRLVPGKVFTIKIRGVPAECHFQGACLRQIRMRTLWEGQMHADGVLLFKPTSRRRPTALLGIDMNQRPGFIPLA